jgi:glycosyltransferase involved in cell wall biosynthesis
VQNLPPEVSVVIATRNRARRLEAVLASLREQTLGCERFEVVVVDDGSTDETAAVLDAEQRAGVLRLEAIHRAEGSGPAAARNAGWHVARAPLVAFTDDDCVADPQWLEAGLTAWAGDPLRLVQGATTPIVQELADMGPCSYTIDTRRMEPEFSTCNMFYPRALLEHLDGFDVVALPYVGEDTDLAWRAQAVGARPEFAARAHVRHAVVTLGPWRFLARKWAWGDAMLVFARHPELRRQRLFYRYFWNLSHWYLVRLALALALPWRRSLWPLKLWLGRRYVEIHLPHPRHQRPSLSALLWSGVADTVELVGVARGGLRNRTVVL